MTIVVGLCAFLGSLRGLELIPTKWCYRVPHTSPPANYAGA